MLAYTWTWPLAFGAAAHSRSIVVAPFRAAKRFRMVVAGDPKVSAMTASAPAASHPAAKLSTRCWATATVGSGRPGSELPDA